MIDKCETCDNRDYNQYGFYCSVLYPKPEIDGNNCSAYKLVEEIGGVNYENQYSDSRYLWENKKI